MLTASITTSHPTSWAPQHHGLQDFTIRYEAKRTPGFPGRYYVYVAGTKVGWTTRNDCTRTWSACQLPDEAISFNGKLVADGYRTRAEAVEELLTTLAQERGPVQDIVVGLWEPKAVAQ